LIKVNGELHLVQAFQGTGEEFMDKFPEPSYAYLDLAFSTLIQLYFENYQSNTDKCKSCPIIFTSTSAGQSLKAWL